MDGRIHNIFYWILIWNISRETIVLYLYVWKSPIKEQIYFEDSICTFIYLLLLSVLS